MTARPRCIGGSAAAAVAAAAALAALSASGPAGAHHSFAAEFDANDTIMLTGVVTKVEWRNPHTYFFVDVEDDAGAVANWALEMGSPNGLYRLGWRPDSLQIGDVVSVEGFRARDGSLKGNARSVVLSTGERLFAASSVETEPRANDAGDAEDAGDSGDAGDASE